MVPLLDPLSDGPSGIAGAPRYSTIRTPEVAQQSHMTAVLVARILHSQEVTSLEIVEHSDGFLAHDTRTQKDTEFRSLAVNRGK
jgi:hypothetical protein